MARRAGGRVLAAAHRKRGAHRGGRLVSSPGHVLRGPGALGQKQRVRPLSFRSRRARCSRRTRCHDAHIEPSLYQCSHEHWYRSEPMRRRCIWCVGDAAFNRDDRDVVRERSSALEEYCLL